jgi:hypothetical protein
MKTKYQVNQKVKVKGGIKNFIITDFEIFEDIILYYTDDGGAYPEDKLENYLCENLNNQNEKFNIDTLKMEIIKKISENNTPEFISFFSDKLNKSLESLDLINGWLTDENDKLIIFD